MSAEKKYKEQNFISAVVYLHNDEARAVPFLQLLNSNSLDIVIMQGLSGGIGVILTVPIAAGCSAFLLAHQRASVHETSPSQIG